MFYFVCLFTPPPPERVEPIIYSIPGHCCCVVWARATIAAAWIKRGRDCCAFLLERREPHGVPSPCSHSCTACATVCLTVVPSFSDITDVSTIGHSFKNDSRRILFYLDENRPGRQRESSPQPSGTNPTDDDNDYNASTETATAAGRRKRTEKRMNERMSE